MDTWRACKASGHPVVDEYGRATGTKHAYNTVYNWSRKYDELLKAAAKSGKAKITQTRKGYFRKNKLVLHFDKRFSKALKTARKKGWKLTSKVAFALAQRVFAKVDAQRHAPGLVWPKVRRTGEPWQPRLQWVRRWLAVRAWRPRVATKKKKCTSQADCAMMQKFVDKVRFLCLKKPLENQGARIPDPHLHYGYFKPSARYNRDQVGFSS